MGASFCKSESAIGLSEKDNKEGGGTLAVMFRRIDTEQKGYIDLKNLEKLMADDNSYFKGGSARHIMDKYGSGGKMTMAEFEAWWGGTYTTYNDDHMAQLVEDAQADNEQELLDVIPELPEIPHNSNVAISRS